jgi:uncharacterized protein YyaL (SSP411 family)
MVRIAEVTGDAELRRRASMVLESLAEPIARYPTAFGHLLGVADMMVHGAVEIALIGPPGRADSAAMLREVAEQYIPSLVLAGGLPAGDDALALLAGRTMLNGKATAYVCRQFACDAPVTEPDELKKQLERAATAATS